VRRAGARALAEAVKRNPGLEAAIASDPEDPAPYLVYADWLQSQGEPWGELIAVSTAAEGQTDSGAFLRMKKAKSALEAIRATLLTPEVAGAKPGDLTLEWRRGFVNGAKVRPAGLVEPLVASPAAVGLVSLEVLHPGADVVETIARRPPPLATLTIGSPYVPRSASIASLEKIAALPRLEDLHVHGKLDPPGPIEHARLLRLSIDSELSKKHLRALAKASLPALRTLSLGFQGGKRTAEDVLAVIESKGLPSLRALGIFSCVFSADIAARLAKGDLLPRLEQLALKGSFDAESAVEELIANAPAFRHLKLLDVGGNPLPVALADRLMAVLPEAKLDVNMNRPF
jgi:uncharacterized protein (TIGR02996 family)